MIMFKKKSLLGVLCLLVVAFLICAASTFVAAEQVEINGTVYASEWDANDNATSVVIFTEEGEEIAVSNSGKGLELLKLEDSNRYDCQRRKRAENHKYIRLYRSGIRSTGSMRAEVTRTV